MDSNLELNENVKKLKLVPSLHLNPERAIASKAGVE